MTNKSLTLARQTTVVVHGPVVGRDPSMAYPQKSKLVLQATDPLWLVSSAASKAHEYTVDGMATKMNINTRFIFVPVLPASMLLSSQYVVDALPSCWTEPSLTPLVALLVPAPTASNDRLRCLGRMQHDV